MNSIFSDRMNDVPQSFIREILKVAVDPSIISFAGGLPNPDLFPVDEIKTATQSVLENYGVDALQYSNTEGFAPLREFISRRYKEKQGLDIPIKNILITTGSQQGLDLLGKVIINENDDLIIEEPGYLGAIQAFSVYRARFRPVPVDESGMDCDVLKDTIKQYNPKLMYTVPSFQNPSGITYTSENRQRVADIIKGTRTFLIEDNPYGDLRFEGSPKSSFASLIPDNTILLGSFSKTIVPAFRLGWVVAPDHIMEKMVIAKQAADLHSNYFAQRVIHQYLMDFDLDDHVKNIVKLYRSQKQAMISSIQANFPDDVKYTNPEGGMFLWASLPNNCFAMDLFNEAIKEKVAFVPGDPFYVDGKKTNTFRLNYTSADEATIDEGIKRLAKVIKEFK